MLCGNLDDNDGGPKRVVTAYVKCLKGNNVCVKTYDSRFREYELESGTFIRKESGLLLVRILKLLMLILRTRDLTVHLHGVWGLYCLLFSVIKINKQLTTVVSPHGALQCWALSQKWLRKNIANYIYVKRLMVSSDCILCASEKEKSELLMSYPRANVFVLGHPIVVPKCSAPLSCKTLLETMVDNKANGYRIFLCVGRIEAVKGLDVLINAFAKMKKTTRCKLVIVGPDNSGYLEKLRKLTDRLSINNMVIFHEAVDHKELYHIYGAADIFVLNSKMENFGLVIGEAMLCKTPVLTNDNIPWTEIADLGAGWITNSSENSLFNKLIVINKLSDMELNQMGEKGYNYVVDNFAPKVINEKYLRLITQRVEHKEK